MNVRTTIGVAAILAFALLASCTNSASKIAASEQDTTAKVIIEKAEIKIVTDSSRVEGGPLSLAR